MNAGGFGVTSGILFNSVILALPDNENKFYLFYFSKIASDTSGYLVYKAALKYCVVDLTIPGNSFVGPPQVLVPLERNFSLLAVRSRTRAGYWLIQRVTATGAFRSCFVSAAGVGPWQEAYPGGTSYPSTNFTAFKASPDGQKLVDESFKPADTGKNADYYLAVCTYDFNDLTGLMRNEKVVHKFNQIVSPYLDPGGPSFPLSAAQIFFTSYEKGVNGACFSPNSRYLYTAENDGPINSNFVDTKLYQYDASKPTAQEIQQSRVCLTPNLNTGDFTNRTNRYRFNDMQLTPDSTVWVSDMEARDPARPAPARPAVPTAITIIRHPNVAGLGCGLALQAFPLPGTVNVAQFPNLVSGMLYPPTAVLAEVSCAEDSAQFWANSTQTGPPGRWDFGDPGSGAANAAVGYYVAHRYPSGGTYAVTLTYPNGRILRREVQIPAGQLDFGRANVFTPNGDGLNDEFRPVAAGAVPGGAQLRVYSRWGQLVYAANGPSPRWNGGGASAGSYFYLLTYTDCRGQSRQRRGVVELIR